MSSIVRHRINRLASELNFWSSRVRTSRDDRPHRRDLLSRLSGVVARVWYLGLTSFGGPPVHFAILHQKFVVSSSRHEPWIDEQTYQDVFALCQSLPGPGSTKMLFTLIFIHAGFVPAVVGFFLWSMPGAAAMFALSTGIANAGDTLPLPVYGLLSGLNAASVGVITLAAVELSTKAAKDNLTRLLVIGGGCAGLCYSALWYFPVLIAIGGVTAYLWDIHLSRLIGRINARRQRRSTERSASATERLADDRPLALTTTNPADGQLHRRVPRQPSTEPQATLHSTSSPDINDRNAHTVSLPVGMTVIASFIATFVAIITVRSLAIDKSIMYNLFSNMFLAGTIIFGGGPVVIPLLREYVVEPGWVSPRDFLIGLAVIQAMPGPNFNFAVYLGALALHDIPPVGLLGAVLGFLGIFAPGIVLTIGFICVWDVLRTKPWAISILRGVNSIAVGFVFTAVYRLWEIGFLTAQSTQGKSLAQDPWWLVIAVLAYSGSCWYKVPPAVSILGGAVLGLGWYGVTK